jgi:hypothetical protein
MAGADESKEAGFRSRKAALEARQDLEYPTFRTPIFPKKMGDGGPGR